jgi:predicted transcriptional regulator
MHQAGVPGTQIAKKLGHPKSTVYTVIYNDHKRRQSTISKTLGRPKKFLKRDQQTLK